MFWFNLRRIHSESWCWCPQLASQKASGSTWDARLYDQCMSLFQHLTKAARTLHRMIKWKRNGQTFSCCCNELHLNILFLFWYFIHFSANESIWFFFLSLFPHRKWFYILEITLMMHIWSHVSSVCFKSFKPHIFDLWELSTAPGETPTQAQRITKLHKEMPQPSYFKATTLLFRYYSNPFTCTLYSVYFYNNQICIFDQFLFSNPKWQSEKVKSLIYKVIHKCNLSIHDFYF